MLDGSRRWLALGAAGVLGLLAAGAWLGPALIRLLVSYVNEPLDERNAHAGVVSMFIGAASLLLSIGAILVAWLQLRYSRPRPAELVTSRGNMPNPPKQHPGMASLVVPEGLLDQYVRGRGTIVKELTKLYSRGSRGVPRVRVLHGMGGAGKTTIALAVARQLVIRGVQVWWISATTATDLQTGMRQLARRLGATETEIDQVWSGLDSGPDLLWRLLSVYQGRWLLVIDNADDTRILTAADEPVAAQRGWIRPVTSRYGGVLVTSRDNKPSAWGSAPRRDPPEAPRWCQLHAVDMLSTADGARVLLDHAGTEAGTAEDAAALTDRLGGLALALTLAGRYLADAGHLRFPGSITSFRAYQAELDAGGVPAVFEHRDGMLTEPEARQLVGRTWELSLDLLDNRGLPQARNLLRLLSVLASVTIPFELLDPVVLAASPSFTDLDAPKLRGLLHDLAGLGLLEFVSTSPVGAPMLAGVRIHPLVRDTSRFHLDASGQHSAYLAVAVRLISVACPRDTEDPSAWPIWRTLAPHALYVHAEVTTSETDLDLIVQATASAQNAVRYLGAIGLYRTARDEADTIYRVCLRCLGDRHRLTLATQSGLAWLVGEAGDPVGARGLYSQLIRVCTQTFGSEHPETLRMRANHAWWTGETDDPAGARDRYAALLPILERVSGAEHTDTLHVRAGLAWWTGVAGDAVGARDQYAALLLAQQQISNAEHPDGLRAKANCAWWAGEAGEVAHARNQCRRLLPVFERVYGPEHPDTLGLRASLARWTGESGDVAIALRQVRELIMIRERVSGAEHPETLAVRADLARLTGEAGDPTGAQDQLGTLLPVVERVCGTGHRLTRTVRANLIRGKSEPA